MKKHLMILTLFMMFFCCNGYADDSLNNNDMSELFPEPPGVSEKRVIFEPDPDDWDNDGLKNVEEERYGTDPHDPDSDNDGILDFTEITNGTDPNSKDTGSYLEVIDIESEDKGETFSEDIIDADDLSEETENADEYIDIIPPVFDNEEDSSFSKENENDSISKDSLNELEDEEINQDAMLLDNPSSGADLTPIYMLLLLGDNDGDEIDDDWEMRHFGSTDACDPEGDPDQDNLSNIDEFRNHTNPNNPDSDLDGLTDGWEVLNGLNPTNADSDDDTMPDGWEVTYGLNPLVNDAYNDLDVDGFPNYFEFFSQTDPTNANSHPSGIIYNFDYDNNGNLSAMQRRE